MTTLNSDDIIYIKQNSTYIFAKELLEILHNYDCYCDKRFKKLLTSLEHYIYSKITFPDGVEIIDDYIVYECVKV